MKWPFRGAGTAPLSREEELLINQQAATVGASVISEAVVAATRCEPAEKATRWTTESAAGNIATFRTPAWANYMRTHDLPSSFILAVTAGHVHALEDKRDGGQLLPGRVLKAWDRRAVLIRVPTDQVQRLYEPAGDRQVVLLWLPIDKDDPVPQAAAEGVPGGPAQVHRRPGRSEPASDRRVAWGPQGPVRIPRCHRRGNSPATAAVGGDSRAIAAPRGPAPARVGDAACHGCDLGRRVHRETRADNQRDMKC